MFLCQFCHILSIFRDSLLTFKLLKRKMRLKTRILMWVTVRKPQTPPRQIAANFAADFVSNFFISRPRVFLAEPCDTTSPFHHPIQKKRTAKRRNSFKKIENLIKINWNQIFKLVERHSVYFSTKVIKIVLFLDDRKCLEYKKHGFFIILSRRSVERIKRDCGRRGGANDHIKLNARHSVRSGKLSNVESS